MNHVDIDIKTFFPIVSKRKHKERYEQGDIIGQGTFGRVYKCLDKQTQTEVAIKRYHDDYNDKEIVQEVDVLMKFHHENIVGYINHYKIFDDKSYLLIIEYMDKDLYYYILDVSGPLDPELIKSYLYQLLSGVNYMHENEYMHLDLKTSNILLNKDGVLKICDFGSVTSTATHYIDKVLTTICYRGPESCVNKHHASPSLDIWSIGCVLVEMITKKMCFWDYRDDSYSGGDSSGSYDDKESKLQLDLIYSVKGVNGEKEIPGTEECCEKTKDLLDKLLLYDFTLRITASEALNHELFATTKTLFV